MIVIILCGVFIIYLSYSLFDKGTEYVYADKMKLIINSDPDKDINLKIGDENIIFSPDNDFTYNNEVGYNVNAP